MQIAKSWLYATSGLLLLSASAAHAQTSPAPAAAVAPEGAIEEVVVTGSRISRKDFVAESPIVTLGAEAIQNSGTPALEQTLNQLPQFTASSGSQTSVGGTGPSQRAGRANINLRGLGIARTLILLDGRRLQPSDPLGAVDLNTVNSTIIENVEVITGGASAIYGSDAIAGVVNFISKKRLQGVILDGEYSQSSRNDGRSLNLSATLGGNFADDRGNALLALSYYDRGKVLRSDRPFFDDAGGSTFSNLVVANGTNLVPQAALTALFGGYGVKAPAPSASLGVNADGSVYANNTGANLRYAADSGYFVNPATGGVEFRAPDEPNTIIQPMARFGAFGKSEYAISDHVKIYGQFNYTQFKIVQYSQGVLQATSDPVAVPATNPFVSADLRSLLAARPRPNDPFTYYFTPIGVNTAKYDQSYNIGQLMVGASGSTPWNDWTWDVYGTYGETKETDNLTGYISRQGFFNLVNAPDGGNSICAGGYPLFGLPSLSEACRAYLARPISNQTDLKQYVGEANLQGKLMTLPAGDLRFATGLSYRKNTFTYDPDSQLINREVLATSGQLEGGGSTNVKEIYLELLAPLLKDLPFVDELNLDVAYRLSDYDSIGTVSTYKASVDWRIVPSVRVRAGYQRAIRAPSVGELYAARRATVANIGTTQAGAGDPCDFRSNYRTGANAAQVRALCLATGVPPGVIDSLQFTAAGVIAFVTGNTDLKEETADSYTVGLVWRPQIDIPALSRISTSVDFYQINLTDAIGTVTSAVSIQRCFNGDGASNPTYSADNFYCNNVKRGASGGFASTEEPSQNLAAYKTSGVDFQLDWGLKSDDFGLPDGYGALNLNLVVSYLDTYKIQTLSGAPLLDYAGTIGNAQIDAAAISHPRWKGTASLTYLLGPADVTLRWRYVDGMKSANNVGASAPINKGIHPVSYFDVSGRWRLTEGTEFRAGVANLFDKEPPVWTGQAATDTATYDIFGRRLFVGVTQRF